MARNWPIVWNARWIWAAEPLIPVTPVAPAASVPRELWNRFCYLRKTFELERVPHSVAARVTADSRYVLYVNGHEIARGPARSNPARLSWKELDLAPHLTDGRNVIAALVRFYGQPNPWWIPAAANYQLGFGSFAFEAPEIAIASDASWKATPAPYRRKTAASAGLLQCPTEILDGAAVPDGWSGAGFDDRAWPPAQELAAGTLASNRVRIPVEPYSAPEHDDIAPLTAIPVALTELSRVRVPANEADEPRDAAIAREAHGDGPDLAITYDAQGTTLATPWLEVRGPAGATVDIYAGEDLRSDGLAEIAPRFYMSRYILGGRAAERFEAFEAVGFRYLTVVARGGARIDAAGAVERRYPRAGGAHFESDDLRLNKIWRVGARTLDLCSTDAFLDCPGREQRAWLGDSYIHALLSFVTNADWRLVRRHLRICAHSQRGDGLLGMVAAGDMAISGTTIPDYSLHWVRALARYFDYSGDSALVRELAPVAIQVLAAFERFRAEDGLIRGMPGWIFIDWAMTQKSEVTAALDALYAAALDDFATLADAALGDSRLAAGVRARADRTRAAFELLWDGAAGAYVDAADERHPLRRISQQTNAIAIVSGCAPRARWNRILDCILDESRLVITPTISDNYPAYVAQRMDPAEYVEFDPERSVVAAQPFFMHFVHAAIARAGRRGEMAERCLRWWPQIERSNTTFEEYWGAGSGTGSRCHAWSATPTYDLSTHVLGVRPLAPGYARAEVAPMFGGLRHLEGAVPTPHGAIELTLDRERGGEILIPEGIVAQIRFDDAPLGGATVTSGRHRIAPA
jgi:alpha-L-rhamnosidase